MKKTFRYLILSGLILSACSAPQSAPKAGKSNEKLRVVQLGDSHTAGDYFTDELRQRLQQKRGNGGIGVILPHAIRGQRSATVSYEANGWEVNTSRSGDGDFPMGGVISTSSFGTLTLSARHPSSQVQTVTFTLKPHRQNSQLIVISNGKKQIISGLKMGKWQTAQLEATFPITIQAQGALDLGLINVEGQKSRGVVVSSLGINGAQLTQTQKWRADWVNDLKVSQADIVILAYGTNEAFNDNLDLMKTEQVWRTTIRKIRQQLPKAKIILLGAPESLRSTVGKCGVRPTMLDSVQAMQQRLASQEKIFFWSWEKAMGGQCSMKSWINQGLASKDGVHFTAQGYKLVASRFATDILKLVK